MGEARFLLLVLLPWLWVAPGEAQGPGTEVPVVWAQEGAAAQLPCSLRTPLQDLSLRIGGVTWQHQPDSPPAAQYTMLRLGRGGLRSGRPPLQPRVQLEERRLQRGDFSLWLRPAQRADAGLYHATVYLRDRDRPVTCRLRLRLGQASSSDCQSLRASPDLRLGRPELLLQPPRIPGLCAVVPGPRQSPCSEVSPPPLRGELPLPAQSQPGRLRALGLHPHLQRRLQGLQHIQPHCSGSGASRPSDSVRRSGFPGAAALPPTPWRRHPVFPHCQVGPSWGRP